MSYSIDILPAAEKDCDRLPKKIYHRCYAAITKLEKTPRPLGCKKLLGEGGYRIRVGNYRILYRIDETQKKVYIYRVKHRKDVYRFG